MKVDELPCACESDKACVMKDIEISSSKSSVTLAPPSSSLLSQDGHDDVGVGGGGAGSTERNEVVPEVRATSSKATEVQWRR